MNKPLMNLEFLIQLQKRDFENKVLEHSIV